MTETKLKEEHFRVKEWEIRNELKEYSEILTTMVRLQSELSCSSNVTPSIKKIHDHIVRLTEYLAEIPEDNYKYKESSMLSAKDVGICKEAPQPIW